MTSLDSILIANRGEIALRVMRTARRLGLRTIAIHTDLDAAAPHVRAADLALTLPSYLDIDAVVAAAKESGAGAVHPGYGFLSERAEFARALEEAGIPLVGPSSTVMEQMGRKDAAREIAVKAGVPVVPSYDLGQVGELAFPVLVKAAAGGGGKGMRIVRSEGEFAAAVAAARREAAAAFGDDTILVEKYVESGRHIEVQVLGDSHGNVVHLFERDCSTQRRHQKVLEEAPAPTITDDVRRVVTESAVALAREVGYQNAGTVEFLLDAATEDVYFLEMNTRLQVEHPVTEMAVRVAERPLDLVELQLRVAAGEALPFSQDEVTISGHAIEARVYAEDSFHGFLPQAGTATYVKWPESDAGLRIDEALRTGQVVSTSYDPMLGKVIAHGPDREAARRALVAALDDTTILGLTTNTGFLRTLAAGDAFRDAAIDTAWLDRHEIQPPDDEAARILAVWAEAGGPVTPGPFASDGWRDGCPPAPIRVDLEGEPVLHRTGPGRGNVLGYDVVELARSTDGDVLWLELEVGDHAEGPRLQGCVRSTARSMEVVHRGLRHVFERPDVFGDHGPTVGDGSVVAPMPGTVLAVHASVGQEVAAGEVLGLMEAMKMELALTAPYAGTVTAVDAAVGDQVVLGAELFHVAGPGGDDA